MRARMTTNNDAAPTMRTCTSNINHTTTPSKSNDLHLDEHLVAVQSDGKRSRNPNERQKTLERSLTEKPSIRTEYDASTNKDRIQYGKDKAVDPLLIAPNTADNDQHKKCTVNSDREVNHKKRRKIAQKIHDGRGNQCEEERTCSPKESKRFLVVGSLPNGVPSTADNAQHEISTVSSDLEVKRNGNKGNGDSLSQYNRADFKFHGGVNKDSDNLLHRFSKDMKDQSNKQVIGKAKDDNEKINELEPYSSSKTIPIFFKQIDLHLHEHDVVIQNSFFPIATTEGFQKYVKIINRPSLHYGFNVSRNKSQFVIDNVIDPLLKEGRYFYIKRGNLYELLILTDAKTKWEFAFRVAQKIYECHNRLNRSSQREGENTPKTKRAIYTNEDSPKVYVSSTKAQSSTSNTNDMAAIEALLLLKVGK